MFSKSGDEEVINDECADGDKLLCSMYRQKKLSSVAEARVEMFLKKYKPKIGEKNPISCAKKMDASSLPPCPPVILQKLRRPNYVCSVWLNAHKASPPKCLPSECGWVVQDDYYRLKWYDGEASPTTVKGICHDDSENDI